MALNVAELDKYAAMQREHYARPAKSNPEAVVGWYDYHENVPYETQLLYEFGDIRKPIFPDFAQRRAFDIGCGEGRMIRRMRKFFGHVDGADISPEMAEHAQQRTPGSTIYVATGTNAGAAPSSFYDFAYCTISLQHICVHATRDAIIDDLVRILKPDGKMTLQFLFSREFPYLPMSAPQMVADRGVQLYHRSGHHASWLQNKTDAIATNSGCDVVIGNDELDVVREDFLRKFKTVEFWFYDISIGRRAPRKLTNLHPNSHIDDSYWGTHFIFVHCTGPRQR
jgi:SAM-dependent methyltransferase